MSQLQNPPSIEAQIHLLRGQRVMVGSDLAHLYGVTGKALNQAVKRNRDRFPDDFMFQLNWDEVRTLYGKGLDLKGENPRSQFVTLESGHNIKYLPYVFTEQGVAMLSSVLRSPQAIQVNIEIMRAFVRLRRMTGAHADLARKLEALEAKYDAQFKAVFDAIRGLMTPEPKTPRRLGF